MSAMSSGDLLADRRFTLGETLAAEGDDRGASDLFEQALERAPRWAPAWLALGLARERLGDDAGAGEALERALAWDAAGTLGAGVHRARLSGAKLEAMPAPFVRALFDGYADRFETHLSALDYRGPRLIAGALATAGASSFSQVLDLGCGTGLMARALREGAGVIDGVDLSPRMIERARETGLYRHLTVGDAIEAMVASDGGRFDLVAAADVFVYFGRLDRACHAAAHALGSGGILAFTVQSNEVDDGFRLGEDMRFHHGRAYVEAVLAEAGFEPAVLDAASTRRDRGLPVPGLVVVARKA